MYYIWKKNEEWHVYNTNFFSKSQNIYLPTYFQNQFLGFEGHQCLVLGNPNKKFEMLQDRASGSCVLLDSNKLWMTGGFFNRTAETEIISYNQNSDTMSSVPGPRLPFLIRNHSMIQTNVRNQQIIRTEFTFTWAIFIESFFSGPLSFNYRLKNNLDSNFYYQGL